MSNAYEVARVAYLAAEPGPLGVSDRGLRAAVNALIVANEAALLQVIDERDRAREAADNLSGLIGEVFGIEIGEHSNVNDPWANALAAGREAVGVGKQSESEDCGHPWRIEPSAFAAGVRTCNTCGM